MVFSNIGYSLREAGHHFRRSWGSVFGAIVTIFLSLFIIGLFVLGSSLLENMVGSVEDQVTIQAFLSDDAERSDVSRLQTKIEGWDNVQSVTYKSKDEALQEYKETMSNKNAEAAVAALDGANPVPASLVIKLDDPQQVASVANKLITDPDFIKVADDVDNPAASVLYGQGTVERLFSVTRYVRYIALALIGLLIFIAFVFINNTIRLAISSRRREIAIERLVGASNGFIRGPFIAEGILEALIGALLAVAALHVLIHFGLPILEDNLSFLSFRLSDTVLFRTYVSLIGAGVILGFFGSIIAMRRFLKV